MTKIIEFEESNNRNIHRCEKLSGYIFEDVFDPHYLKLLRNHIENILNKTSKVTFLTHNTSFKQNDQNINLGGHFQNDREQNVVYDLTFNKEYYYQTADSIKDWSENNILNKVSPIFQKSLQKIQSLPPVASNPSDWILYRCHINYLAHLKFLALHYDGNPILTKTKSVKDSRMYSFTYYLEDHIEGNGGELFSVNGFVYKPKKNSAICIPGHKVLHGVTQNKNLEPRLAFTVRLVHKDDLYLPGDPTQWLYDVSSITDKNL